MPLLMNPKLALLSQFAAAAMNVPRDGFTSYAYVWAEAQSVLEAMPPDMLAALEADTAFHERIRAKLEIEFKDAEGDST